MTLTANSLSTSAYEKPSAIADGMCVDGPSASACQSCTDVTLSSSEFRRLRLPATSYSASMFPSCN